MQRAAGLRRRDHDLAALAASPVGIDPDEMPFKMPW
jgi:hypothetical protein